MRGVIQLSEVLAICLLVLCSAGAADRPLQPAEEAFLQEAMDAFEKGDLEAADLSLSRFRALIGTRTVPTEVSSAVLELAFRVSLAKAKSAIGSAEEPGGLSNPDFSKAWEVVQQRTNEWIPFIENVIDGCIDRKNESGAVYAASRMQRARLDRSNVLQAAHAFEESLAELDAAAAVLEKYNQYAEKKITVYIHSPKGAETVQRPRGDAAGLFGPEALAEKRIETLRAWRLADPENDDAYNQLALAYREFVDAHPSHARSYRFFRDLMDLRNSIDIEGLRKVLDATGNKDSTQYVGNQISLANLLLGAKRYDEALPIYEEAAKSEFCPKGRIAEVYVQMADIYALQGRTELAKECYTIARGLTDRFKHIGPALEALDRPKTGGHAVAPDNDTTRFWGIIGFNVAVLIVAAVLVMIRYIRSERKG